MSGSTTDSSYPLVSYVELNHEEFQNLFDLELLEFPYKAITKELFPEIEIDYLTVDLPTGSLYAEEEKLYLSIENELGASGPKTFLPFYIPLELAGFSDQSAYFTLMASDGVAYLRLHYVVNTTDGNYFAIVLRIKPNKSICSIDIYRLTITFELQVDHVEIVDQDRATKSVQKEFNVRFVSTEKFK